MALEDDLRTFTLAHAPVSAIVGAEGMHYGVVPQDKDQPFLWFLREAATSDGERCFDDAVGADPFRHFFALECFSPDPAQVQDLARKVNDRLNNYRGALGASSVQLVTVEDQADDYQFRSVDDDSGTHAVAFRVEVVP